MKNLFTSAFLLASCAVFSQNTFTTINNIFQAKCTSCHSGGSPAGGLNLSGTEAQIYSRLVEVAPINATAAAKGDMLIDKGYPERSFLLRKVAHGLSDDLILDSGEGLSEPNGQTKLEDHEIELIRQWVIYAAPQIGNVVNYQRLIDYYTAGGRPKITRPAAPPAGQGMQIHFGPVFWAPSEESEYFKKFDPRFTQNIEAYKVEVHMNTESHHYILRKFQPGQEQGVSDGLEGFNTDGFNRDFVNAWQTSADIELPAGTGFFWDNTTVFDLNYHMKNYHTTEILPGEFYMNIWYRPRSTATVEMKAELIPNVAIFIPGNNQPTVFTDDVQRSGQTWNIWMLSTHTHKYGIDYDIFQRNSNGSQGTQLYEGHYDFNYNFNQGYYDYTHPPVRRFNPMLSVNMSNGLLHKATYKNTSSNFVTWGFTTDGEMMLIYVQYTTQTVNYKPPVSSTGGGACTPVVLSTDGGLRSYLWSNGDTTETVTITQSGTYTVTVTDGTGATYTSDPVTVTVNAASVSINNGSDPAICNGQSASLDAGIATSYNWSTGATTQSINVSATGTYQVTITAANGCTATDVAVVTSAQGPVVLLNDASFCAGENATLDAGNAGANFLWSTGASTQTIAVSNAGNYYVTVTDANGCATSDNAAITVHALPAINIADVTICMGSSATLDAGNAGSSFLWSNGATTQMIFVNQPATYSVTVTDSNGCEATDIAALSFGTNLSVNIADANVCDGESTILDAGFTGATYLWSNGATTQTIEVATAGSYSVTVDDPNGCNGSGTSTVTVLENPVADAGEDKLICEGESVTLTASGGASYRWSTGDVTAGITVDEEGSYNVTVVAANGCDATDKAQVDVSEVLTGDILGNASVETGSTIAYAVNNNTGSTYDWQVSNGTIISGQGTASVEVTWGGIGTGSLQVAETNADNCTGETVLKLVNIGSTGITGVPSSPDLKIFPNPFTSSVTFRFPNPGKAEYRLNMVDVTGKTVKTVAKINGEEVTIVRENLPAGVYFIELRGEITQRGKVVIAN